MATLLEQLHGSKAHRDGFDPNCPVCMKDRGINGILDHLNACAKNNEKDAKIGSVQARAVAAEQRRMIGILKLYRRSGRV